jgi:hypothetical protein
MKPPVLLDVKRATPIRLAQVLPASGSDLCRVYQSQISPTMANGRDDCFSVLNDLEHAARDRCSNLDAAIRIAQRRDTYRIDESNGNSGPLTAPNANLGPRALEAIAHR